MAVMYTVSHPLQTIDKMLKNNKMVLPTRPIVDCIAKRYFFLILNDSETLNRLGASS